MRSAIRCSTCSSPLRWLGQRYPSLSGPKRDHPPEMGYQGAPPGTRLLPQGQPVPWTPGDASGPRPVPPPNHPINATNSPKRSYGLDARDREVLDYSLRRRVPDEDLSTLFGVDASEVARMRGAAVERLSNALGVQRGEDLGHMLKLLLDSATWDHMPAAAPPREPSHGRHPPVPPGWRAAAPSRRPRSPSRPRTAPRARAGHARRPPGGRARGASPPNRLAPPRGRSRGCSRRARSGRDGRRPHRLG